MSLEERTKDLRAVMGEHHSDLGPLLFVAVVCNGCGRQLTAPNAYELSLLTEEWALGSALGADDFCAECRP